MKWKRRAILFTPAITAWAAKLSPADSRKFDEYAARIEGVIAQPLPEAPFRAGEVEVSSGSAKNPLDVGDAYLHDWIGRLHMPGAAPAALQAALADFGRHPVIYAPDVVNAALVRKDGDVHYSTMRLKQKKVITVVLNAEFKTRFTVRGESGYSVVHSTRIAEVENAGEKDERESPVGGGHGFLWRLNSYWRWRKVGEGVNVELRSISLTRSVPALLGAVIGPFLRSVPRESLEFTLTRTRDALRARD